MSRASEIVAAARRRKIREPLPVETFRCARLADPSAAISDLASVGSRPVPKSSKRIVSKGISELIQLIHHVDVKVFGGDPKSRKDRYSAGFIALYAGDTQTTAELEIRHYVITRFAITNPKQEIFELSVFSLEFLGKFRDLCGLEVKFPEMLTEDKSTTQAVGAELSTEPSVKGLKVPSARHYERRTSTRYANWVLFENDTVTPIEILGTLRYILPYDKLGRRRAAKREFIPR